MDTDFDTIVTASVMGPHIRQIGVMKVAEQAGVAGPTLYLWLDGRRTIALEARLRIAQACGYTVGVSVKPPRRYGPRPKAEAQSSPSASVQAAGEGATAPIA